MEEQDESSSDGEITPVEEHDESSSDGEIPSVEQLEEESSSDDKMTMCAPGGECAVMYMYMYLCA